MKSYVEYDPQRAEALLDSIGLDRRDSEGYRTYPDGSRMVWYLNYPKILLRDPVQFVLDDWRAVGIRAVPRERSLGLFGVDSRTLRNDFAVWQGLDRFLPLIGPSDWIPVRVSFYSAIGFANWYLWGGLYGDPKGIEFGGIEPPPDHPLRRAMVVLDEARRAVGFEAQRRIIDEVFDTASEEVWSISIFASPPHPVVVKDGFRNVPRFAIYSPYFSVPSHAGMDTYFIENASETPGTLAQIKREMVRPTPDPRLGGDSSGFLLGKLVRWLLAGIAVAGTVMVGLRHPFVGRRLLILIPTLLIISVVAFITIQMPQETLSRRRFFSWRPRECRPTEPRWRRSERSSISIGRFSFNSSNGRA